MPVTLLGGLLRVADSLSNLHKVTNCVPQNHCYHPPQAVSHQCCPSGQAEEDDYDGGQEGKENDKDKLAISSLVCLGKALEPFQVLP